MTKSADSPSNSQFTLGDPPRPPPPGPPFRATHDSEPTISLMMTNYIRPTHSITAFDLSNCLAAGFKTAAENLADHTVPARAGIQPDQFLCDDTLIRIVVSRDTNQRVHALNYLDLASVMVLIQKFQFTYTLPNIVFSIEYTADQVRYTNIGVGSVTYSPYSAKGGNATALA